MLTFHSPLLDTTPLPKRAAETSLVYLFCFFLFFFPTRKKKQLLYLFICLFKSTQKAMQSVEEIAEFYEAKPRPQCPSCHTNDQVAFIARGRPTAQLLEYSERPNSRVKLGGCIVSPSDPKFYCNRCQSNF